VVQLQAKGLGKRFTTHLRHKLNHLKQNPYTAANRYDEVKTAVIDIFSFMAHYTIDGPQKLIIISAVLHTSRNPDIWKTERGETDNID
jgi:plasmid stabilization system protein ParE